MQPQYTLEQTLAAIANLNKVDQPFSYSVQGNQIVGEWKYLDVNWAGFFATGNEDKEFKTIVTLNEHDHTYTQTDERRQSESKASFDPSSGTLSFGKSATSFSGRSIGKEFGFGIGIAKQEQNNTSLGDVTYKYSFSTEQLKQPLRDYLAQLGWQPAKRSLFGKIFG